MEEKDRKEPNYCKLNTNPIIIDVQGMESRFKKFEVDRAMYQNSGKVFPRDFMDMVDMFAYKIQNGEYKRGVDYEGDSAPYIYLQEKHFEEYNIWKTKDPKKEVFSKMKPFAIEYYLKFKDEPWMTADTETGRARKVLKKLNEVFPNSLFYPSLDTIRKDWLNAHFKPHLKPNGGR
jgi:hypothetical protein